MAISLANLHSLYKDWSASITLDGISYPIVDDLPERSMGLTQQRSTCAVQLRDIPLATAGAATTVTITLNGETETYFVGYLDRQPRSDLPLKRTVNLVDVLGRANRPLPSTLTWSNTAFATAVRQVLNAAGIANGQIASIDDPGNDFKLGAVYPIEIAAGTEARSILDALMSFGGTGLFVQADGKVRVADFPGWPDTPTGSTPIYAYAADRSAGEFGFLSSDRTIGGVEDVVAKFTAKGPRRPDRTIPDATFTLEDVSGEERTEQYAYLQTEVCAKKIAEREIVRRNRSSTEVSVEAPLHPSLRPGDTLLFRNEFVGFIANTPAIVLSIRSRGDVMTLLLSVGARPPDGSLTTIQPPVASFTMQYERQTVTVAGITAVRTFVQATSTASDPGGFTITGLNWTADCPDGVTPQSSSDPNPIFVFESLVGASITLVVESSSGEGATSTQAVAPGDAAIFTRTLSVATADGWKVLATTAGWRTFAGPGSCTAVPGFNDQAPLIAGFSGGELYRSQDFLATTPELLYTFPDQVNCLFVNELIPTHVVAGADATAYVSNDGAETWLPMHTFPDAVAYIETSPTADIYTRVCAGNTLWFSTDGETWTALLAGPTGSIARKLASAPWGHAVVFSGTSAVADVIQFEEGYTVDWSAVPVEQRPLELTTITALLNEPGYIVATGAAQDLVRDGLFPSLAYLANDGEATTLYKLTQSGSNFVASLITTTSATGPHKIGNLAAAFPIDTPDAYRIGYGQPNDLPFPPEVVILPQNSPTFWHYKPGTGYGAKNLPRAGVWNGLAINPARQNEWIIWHQGDVGVLANDFGYAYLTRDEGVTWLEITNLSNHAGDPAITGVVFTGQGSAWCMTALRAFDFAGQIAALNIRGNGAAVVAADFHMPATSFATSERAMSQIVRGSGGDVIGVAIVDSQWYRFATGSVVPTLLYPGYGVPADLKTLSGQQLVGIQTTNLTYTGNYATTAPSPIIAAGTSAVWCADGVYVGGREGIARVASFPEAPALAVVAAAGLQIGAVSTGPKKLAVAALAFGDAVQQLYGYNGTSWASADLPASFDYTNAPIGAIER